MQTFDTKQPIDLSIKMSRGIVHVIAGERTDTVVTVEPSDPGVPADVEATGKTAIEMLNDRLVVEMPKPGGIAAPVIGWKKSGSIDVTVELPHGSSLHADTGVADFRCDGRLGDVEVRTGIGNVRLDEAGSVKVHAGTGGFSVETAHGNAEIVSGGDLNIGTVTGDARVKNINGKTWIGRVQGTARVKSANGDVTIDDAGGDVTVKTANGSVRLGRLARGSTTVETASGGLELGISEGTAAWIDANTRFGRILNNLSPADGPAEPDETVEVRARTAFGDVVITRS